MIRLPFALAVALAVAPAFADPIDGTWKSDLASMKLSDKPDVSVLAKGKYTCVSCVPSFTVAADGKFHKVAGQDYWDEASVTVLNKRAVAFAFKRKGKIVSTATDMVSADGATLTSRYKEVGTANGVPVEGGSTDTRVAPAPAGTHAVSGSWQRASVDQTSAAGLNQTFRLDGDTLHLTTPTGESYDAKIGGPAVPIVGDPAGTMVAVTKTGDTYQEAGSRGGKPVYVMKFTPSADGRTLAVTTTNLKSDRSTSFTATKQ